jgi:GST-like protein
MDAQLSVNKYLAGDSYSIADIITWPWAFLIGRLISEESWLTYPHLKRWVDEVASRPAVQAGRKVGEELGKRELTDAEEKARREILFNQTNDKVKAAREVAAQLNSE